MKIRRMDHVGVIVKDLAAAQAFFVGLGLEVVGEGAVGGDWVGQVIGLSDVKAELVMLQTSDGETKVELVRFRSPAAVEGTQRGAANALGIRHVAFVVDDVDAVVAAAKRLGGELVGRVADYEKSYRLCYVRGPEGIILELAQEL